MILEVFSRVADSQTDRDSEGGTELGRLESVDDYEARGEDREKPMPSSFFIFDMDEGLVE
jgi:hypothetical protein